MPYPLSLTTLKHPTPFLALPLAIRGSIPQCEIDAQADKGSDRSDRHIHNGLAWPPQTAVDLPVAAAE